MKKFPLLSALSPLLFLFPSCGPSGGGPFGLKAEASIPSQVTLRWTEVPGADHYRVYRLWSGLVPTLAGKAGPGGFYQDSQLDDGTTYLYQVSAVVDGREGGRSDSVRVTTHPGQVKDLSAGVEGTAVRIRWKAQPGVKAYRVFRETEAAEAEPADFQVEAGSEFLDRGAPAGLTHRYFVLADLPEVAYSYGGASFALVKMPGTAPAAVDRAKATSAGAPVVQAEGRPGGVQLRWNDQGPGVSYRVTRGSGAGAEVRAEGLQVPAFWDRLAPAGAPSDYRVTAVARAGSAESAPVRATAGAKGPARPDTVLLNLNLEGQPVQKAELRTADRSLPFRGVLVLLGGTPDNLPQLVRAAEENQWAVLTFGAFDFGSGGAPRPLTTRVDQGHAIQVLDLRRPAQGSAYLAQALGEAARVWSDHPELGTVPLAGWAFSQTGVSLVQVLSRPEWEPRVAALIHGDVLEVDATIPLFRLRGVPQLFLLAGREDSYSQLLQPMAYVPGVPRRDYLTNLLNRHGFPLTEVSRTGQGHGGGLDIAYAGVWLDQVLAQTAGSPVLSWAGRSGWTATFGTELTADRPWGDGRKKGLRLTNPKLSSGGEGPVSSWFPSRRAAEEWLSTAGD